MCALVSRYVSLCVCAILFYYPWKHRPFEALNAVLLLHPLASASCCRGMVAMVITTTPSNASAATSAIIAS